MPRTKASNEAQYRYNASHLKRVPLDLTKEKYSELQSAASAAGESVNGYIKRSIDERMERASDLEPLVTPQSATNQEEGLLTAETIEAAQQGAKSTGETIPEFLSRAVTDTLKRDKAVLLLGVNPAGKNRVERGGQAKKATASTETTETAPQGGTGDGDGGGLAP